MDTDKVHLVKQSSLDILEDFALLNYLISDLVGKLEKNKKRLTKLKGSNHPSSIDSTLDLLHHLATRCAILQTAIITQKQNWTKKEKTEKTVKTCARELTALFEEIRSLTHVLGATITTSDWQSPSYDASGYQQAGRQTGKIHATQNDYKRDQHEDAFAYEQAFCREYIDTPLKYQMHVHATHSGMAAFTTVLGFLIGQKHIRDSVLVGTNVYFEVKQLLQSLLQEKYHEVDETNLHVVQEAIQKWQPDAFFFDTIGNTPTMAVPDIKNILKIIQKTLQKEVYVVIDNTTTSIFVQPFLSFFPKNSRIHTIVFESLNKFHQFGMDGVFGGIIYSRGGDSVYLFDYRRNMGTNISDSAVISLPTPNRKLLTKRLQRIERNARMISNTIQDTALSHTSPIDFVKYPGLPTHPNHANIRGFAGPFLTLAFKTNKQSVRILHKTVEYIMKQAKEEKIPLIAGTSFGLTTTRIYQTATNSKMTTPFLRISPGTEYSLATHKLSLILAKCVRTMT